MGYAIGAVDCFPVPESTRIRLHENGFRGLCKRRVGALDRGEGATQQRHGSCSRIRFITASLNLDVM